MSDKYINEVNSILNYVQKGDVTTDTETETSFTDAMAESFEESKHLEAAANELFEVIDMETGDQSEDVDNAFIRKSILESFCNGLYFAAKREERNLHGALDELSEAERNGMGTEICENKIENVLVKIERIEKKMHKYRGIYSTIALRVYPEQMGQIIDTVPDKYSQNMTRKFEPWQKKSQYKRNQVKKSATAGKMLAREKLEQYNR